MKAQDSNVEEESRASAIAERTRLANEAAEALLKEEAEAAEKLQQSRSKAAKKKAKKSAR